ncbi:MAG: Crp/Fnr family transcriptional regulator [Chitinophagales bacterium]|nr:Crp/Fnr family transcriptional regulator [Chitinophagales bacterium]
MDFGRYLVENLDLTLEEERDILLIGKNKSFAKGEIILPPDNKSSYIYFIESGLVKMFYFKEDKSITHYFLSENDFITRTSNFYANADDSEFKFGLQSLESQTRVFLLPFAAIQELAKANLSINNFIQKLLLNLIKGYSNRLYSLQFENAKDRYAQLLRESPEILLRAPLGDIASYLGISQQTLSVIRGQVK